jgi:hypothetical protein
MTLLTVIIASALFWGIHATSIDEAKWMKLIGLCATAEEAISDTSYHFAMIAADINAEYHMERLDISDKEFETATTTLKAGDGIGVPEASEVSKDAATRLESLQDAWYRFKKIINDHAETIAGKPMKDKQNVLNSVDMSLEEVKSVADQITSIYVQASSINGGSKSVNSLKYAIEQLTSVSSLTKDLILLSFELDKSKAISSTIAAFNSRHTVLLEGDPLQGIPMMSDVCKLYVMTDVTYLWRKFAVALAAIVDSEDMAASATTYKKSGFADAKMLLTKMREVRNLIIEDNNECNPSKGIPIEQWSILTNRAGKQRMLSQKSVRLFANIAAGVAVTDSKVDLVMALDAANSNLYELLFGSKQYNVPSPLSSGVAESLGTAKSIWDTMEVELRTGVTRTTIDERVLMRCARLSPSLLAALNNATNYFVAAAASFMPSLQAAVIDMSGSQRMLMQKMSKEAMLVFLNIDPDENILNMKSTMAMWRASHSSLIHGGIPKTNTSSGVPRTTNVCILQQMQDAFGVYKTLETLAYNLAEYGNGSTELHEMNAPAFAAMNKAVSMYGTIGAVSCELREYSVDVFKAFLSEVGNLRMLSQRVQKDFLSKSMDLNTTIAEIGVSFENLLLGGNGVRAAPTQPIANELFDLETVWFKLKSALETSTAIVSQDSLSSKSNGSEAVMTLDGIEAIMGAYMTLTEDSVTVDELPARKLNIASRQRMLVERMAKEALLARESSADDQLQRTMAEYESAHAQLISQTHSGEDRVLERMGKAETTWLTYKSQLLVVASGNRKNEMQKQLDLILTILEEIEALCAEVVAKPAVAERRSFLLLQVSIPAALVVVPSLVGFIRGFVS